MEDHRLRHVLLVFAALVCIAVLATLYWFTRLSVTSPTQDAGVIESLSALQATSSAPVDPQMIKSLSATPATQPKPVSQSVLDSLSSD